MHTRAPAALDVDSVERLLGATGEELAAVMADARALRDEGLERAGRPRTITYSRKVFVPLTTLCRDRCHYCVFVDTPGQLALKRMPAYMNEEQVLRVARSGAALGCREVLLTLGDRPEERWPEARAWLDAHGFASTLDYVGHVARLITRETGLLAHLNPGVMSADELRALRPSAPSMGMMLETTSRALYETPGAAHYRSPDKDPAVRLRTIDDAGAARIPFTSGILVGIGETVRDRAESLVALRDAHARHGHLQETIVQNFRAKPGTPMRGWPDAEREAYLASVAVARLVMGADARIQAPPNLSDRAGLSDLIAAGIDDWGGVSPLTADHVNPERPWPNIHALAEMTAETGYVLRERLTAHPEYVCEREEWIDPALHDAVASLAGADGLAAAHTGGEATPAGVISRPAALSRLRLAEAAASDPLALDDDEWESLLTATGADLEAVASVADEVRRLTVGEAVSIVVNRNLTSSGLRRHPQSESEFTLADAGAVTADARDLGATEVCIQGALPPTEDPDGYIALARACAQAVPGMHLHAFRPADLADLADRSGRSLTEALAAVTATGVRTIPGTGVKILDNDVRARIAPGDVDVDRWEEVVRAAHGAGLRSSSVMFYGHGETARHRIWHLRRLRGIQDDTGGFTEFVPIPLPGHDTRLMNERSHEDEHRAMVAVSRLMLNGSIRHLQIPWTRHGLRLAGVLLQAGGDDLGGTLLDGRVRPAAGIEQGLELPIGEARRLAGRIFRPLRQRTTDYGEVPA